MSDYEVVVDDKETDSGPTDHRRVKRVLLQATRDPVPVTKETPSSWPRHPPSSDAPGTPTTTRLTDDQWGKAIDAYEDLGKALDTGAFAPPEGAAAWKSRAAKAIAEIADSQRDDTERDEDAD